MRIWLPPSPAKDTWSLPRNVLRLGRLRCCLLAWLAACAEPDAQGPGLAEVAPVRVAVLDEGFGGYEALLGGALPSAVEAHLHAGSEAVSHGTAVAEVVHALAPEAELVLVSFVGREDFPGVVAGLEALNVDIVVASVGWDNVAALDGTSPWTSAVDTFLASSGALWFNAAGNSADATRRGPLTAARGRVAFSGAASTPVYTAGGSLSVRLRATAGATLSGLQLLAWEEDGSLCASRAAVAGAAVLELDTACASDTVRVTIEGVLDVEGAEGVLWARHGFMGGAAPAPSSLAVPADTRHGLTVGVCDPVADTVSAFSGRGPTEDGRTKPDLCAADGLTTETAGPRAFTGTSAANAWVGGLAARLWGDLGDAEAVRAALRERAVDLQKRGVDDATGWGAPVD